MNTPICDFVKSYSEKNPIRLHMPGHKGIGPIGCERLDITEISGADVLYSAKGIINTSEQNAAILFESKATFYSTEGSSLSIRAMLYLTKKYALQSGKKPLILAGRNAHKTFVTASALLDIEVEWLYPKENILSLEIDAAALEKRLKELKPAALFITSPDYLGKLADIEKIAQICKKNDALLLVDNAHGSYLKFLENSLHPLQFGADLCCDSAHKTLPVLTGGGYLHIGKNAPEFLAENAENALSLFASTSPSYIILQSLDCANLYLENDIKNDLKRVASRVKTLKEKLKNHGFFDVSDEPLKVTLATKKSGYFGFRIAEMLEQKGIFSEFFDPDFITFMFSSKTTNESIEMLEKELLSLKIISEIITPAPTVKPLNKAISFTKALFSEREKIKVENATGKVLADLAVNCPPAVCVAVLGEEISREAVNCFKYYGIDYVFVVKE